MNFKLYIFMTLCFPAVLFVTPACSAIKKSPIFVTHIKHANDNQVIRDKILTEFVNWKGVKYKLGGNSRDGIDCSSLVQKIYHSALGDNLPHKLPRTTSEQIKQGIRTAKKSLKPGDLVFFQMTRNERHVGVYIGGKKFIHASTKKGVIVSDMNEKFWEKRYQTARRVLAKK